MLYVSRMKVPTSFGLPQQTCLVAIGSEGYWYCLCEVVPAHDPVRRENELTPLIFCSLNAIPSVQGGKRRVLSVNACPTSKPFPVPELCPSFVDSERVSEVNQFSVILCFLSV